jgi:NAD-dependent DNA ligase
VWSNHLLYCYNVDCSAKSSKAVEHFAKTLKIKGLGPAAVDKLCLSDPSDIYRLSEGDIAAALSSKKLATKLFAEIQNSKQAPANFVLPALGIPLIGKSATEKLSTIVESVLDITEDSCAAAGLGPKATENLMEWLKKADIANYWAELPLNFNFQKSQRGSRTLGAVCISGKLKSFKTKAEATKALENKGYITKSSLTKDVTILINESGLESLKTKKARESGIIIITDLFQLLGE